MKRIDKVYDELRNLCMIQYNNKGKISGVSAVEIASRLNLQRTNVSSDLNELVRRGKVEKIDGKPVLYRTLEEDSETKDGDDKLLYEDVFDSIIGANLSLKNSVQQARAAIIYPPNGLHTLIYGETGTGKSMFAEVMYEYAKSIGRIKKNAPFITFNCADYANNPQLLVSHLFGVRKGAYTGADRDRTGLVEKADTGILFLDEVHRLPPEGQEMLFYLIDKGLYRKLGESDVLHKANVLIICATTENVESSLLKTFTRRIPMIIKLPALKERTFEERYELIKNFFSAEVPSIKEDITVTQNALKALLLYDCPSNIGQLKSDIKLCCAKAFLGYMMKRDKEVCVHIEDLPDYVRRGIFKYKEHKDKIAGYVSHDIITFSNNKDVKFKEKKAAFNFYEALEEKRKILDANGLSEKDIKLIMSLDIETYLKKYLIDVDKSNLEEIYKVVDKKIVKIVDEFLKHASKKLNKEFNSRIFYGLCMHISSSIQRIMEGKNIENHELENIKANYKKEYSVAEDLKEMIEKEFKIIVPPDEVGFITMFLCLENDEADSTSKVSVVVAMHGESAATSIADVCNRLLDEENVFGYNMPLDQKPETALENLIELVKRIDNGKGVLLLVDMGSLALFGDMIYEMTGIAVKTIDMVSTPMALEASRRALLGSSLEEVYDSVINLSPYVGKIYKESFDFKEGLKENVIITACITGEGTAVKLKSIIEKNYDIRDRNINIIPIDITSKKEFRKKINKIKQEKNVLAVVSAINPEDSSLLYISTSDIFDKQKNSILVKKICILDNLELIYNMKDIIRENVKINSDKYIDSFKKFYFSLIRKEIPINKDSLIGLMLHIACAVSNTLNGKMVSGKVNKSSIEENHDKFISIREAVNFFEDEFNITISDEECINIMKIIYSI